MNRFVGFTLIGGFLAIGAAASGSAAPNVSQGRNAYLATPVIEQPLGSVERRVTEPAAPLAPASTTHRIIIASQPAARAPLAPAAAELAPASQLSPSSCPPARTEVACRKP